MNFPTPLTTPRLALEQKHAPGPVTILQDLKSVRELVLVLHAPDVSERLLELLLHLSSHSTKRATWVTSKT